MHTTPRFHETDSSEPHVDNGYRNTIILNTKYKEEWNS